MDLRTVIKDTSNIKACMSILSMITKGLKSRGNLNYLMLMLILRDMYT